MIKIHFKDCYQDFLLWLVDEMTGQIHKSAPKQTSVWSKYRVTNLDTLQVGGLVEIENDLGEKTTVNYPVTKIEKN